MLQLSGRSWMFAVLIRAVLGVLLLWGVCACGYSAPEEQPTPSVIDQPATPDSTTSLDADPLVGTYQLRSRDPQGQELVGGATIVPARFTLDVGGFNVYLAYLVGVTFPLLIGALLINWFLVNLLLGVREYYADHYATRVVPITSLTIGLKRLRERYTFTAGRRRPTRLAPVGDLALLPIHPSPAHRWRALHAPALVFIAPWKIGATVWGVIALFYSLSATLFSSVHARQPDTLIPVALAFVLLATALTPHLVLAQGHRRFRHTGLSAVAVYSLLLLGGQTLVAGAIVWGIFALSADLHAAVNLVNGLLSDVQLDDRLADPYLFLDLAIIRPLLFTLIATPTLLVLALAFDTWLKRIILRCYAAPWSLRQRNWFLLGCTLVVALLLQCLVIPLISWPFFPDFLTYREVPLILFAGLALLAAAGWGGLLWSWWRRYGNRCPQHPDHRIQGTYGSTDVCPVCGAALRPWLTESPDA